MAIVSNAKLAAPGDLIIEDITLTSASGFSLSIWNLIYSVEIYEDLYSNALSGRLVFGDSLALSRHLPLVGEEKIKLVFYTPGQQDQPQKKIELNMRVYKISQRLQLGADKAVMVTVEIVSEEFFQNSTIKFSKSFSRVPYSDMVKNIFDEYINPAIEQAGVQILNDLERVHIFPTSGPRTILIPYWSPFYAINWLANKSCAVSNPSMADYMFFQSMDGSYQFMPISHFKSMPVTASYTHTPPDKTKDLLAFSNITDYSIISAGNRLQDIGSGVFSSILTTFDMNTKKIESTAYRYSKNYTDVDHIDKYPLVPSTIDIYSDKVMSYRKVLPKNSYRYNNLEDNETHDLYALSRQSLLNQMNTIVLQATASGDSRRRVGDIVELKIVSQEDTAKKDDPYDPYLSGNYMITKINHSFTHDDYEIIMTLAKDSYASPLPDKKESTLKVL